MATVNDFNRSVIDEFRSNDGKLSGPMEGAPLLLLTTTGAKSGRKHTMPVAYLRDGDRIVVFGSKAGAPTHPAWYHNLIANPTVTVELPGEQFEARAVVTDGEERERLFARQKSAMPGFADYERKTTRVIPVIALERM
ncbi:MAG TPA: nitroreductase family deazaflavin-dependent oxidoreductase [Acidimicrobiia bacterium]|nr:nitroreductase family deazaflavin-dependent oxidoreductase [Acidimicrobiia bacterium]